MSHLASWQPPLVATRTGGQLVPRVQSQSQPSCLSPSTRSPMGRSRIRGTPSRMYLRGGVTVTADSTQGDIQYRGDRGQGRTELE